MWQINKHSFQWNISFKEKLDSEKLKGFLEVRLHLFIVFVKFEDTCCSLNFTIILKSEILAQLFYLELNASSGKISPNSLLLLTRFVMLHQLIA